MRRRKSPPGQGTVELVVQDGVCIFCGCTEEQACDVPGGCAWVDDDETVCSACAEDLAKVIGECAGEVLAGGADIEELAVAVAHYLREGGP